MNLHASLDDFGSSEVVAMLSKMKLWAKEDKQCLLILDHGSCELVAELSKVKQ